MRCRSIHSFKDPPAEVSLRCELEELHESPHKSHGVAWGTGFWTSKTPTEPGYYWVRNMDGKAQVAELWFLTTDWPILEFCGDDCGDSHLSGYTFWSERLKEPS